MLKFLSCLFVFFFAVNAGAQTANQWPQFLGPHRNGISAETGLLDSWPQGGPREVWRVKGGVGMSGLAISRGRLLTMIQNEGQQHVICLDSATGQRIWQTPVGPEYRNGQGHGPGRHPRLPRNWFLVSPAKGFSSR